VFFLTDNGYAFGEHRSVGKRCPYDECVRTPFAVRVPWMRAETLSEVVSNADLAPTIADLARTAHPAVDGESLAPLFVERGERNRPDRPGVLIEWAGDAEVPAWWGLRTASFAYIETVDGTTELYDLTGRLGPPDPAQLDNRARDPRYGRVLVRLAGALDDLRSLPPGRR
jgi:arylsulfatase A-like enzyme